MASNASFLRQGSSLLRSISTVNRPIVMAQTKSLSSLTKTITCPQLIPRVANVTRVRCMATEGDKQLATFLQEEIQTEKKNARPLPKLDGWSVKTDGSEVKLTRVGAAAGEQVQITLNVNHTVDSAQPDDGTGEPPEMLSRPDFEVDITKGGKTLSFSCSYAFPEETPENEEEGIEDIFEINEVLMFEGENHGDECYKASGQILDGYMYDLLMTMLEERGVDNNFAERLAEWCTSYEHSRYVTLLEDIDKWIKL